MELMTLSELGTSARLMAMPIFLTFVGIVVLLSDLIFDREDERRWPAYLTIAGLVGALFLWVQSWLVFHPTAFDNRFFGWLRGLLGIQTVQQAEPLFGGMFEPVGYASMTLLISLLVVVVALVVTLLAPSYLERRDLQRGEFYALILFATVGLIMMAGGSHLILIFLGLELLSIPLYILAGFARPNLESEESGLKYFLLGAFATGFLLYGIALIYGATGTMNLTEIRDLLLLEAQTGQGTVLLVDGSMNLMLVAGLVMLLVAIGFKISLVPFHQWVPDVYEGAPTPVTAFMVAGTKAGGFAALINIMIAFIALYEWWAPLIAILALLTMLGGNIGAILQRNVKRMLAYSSIAHAGYMLVGVAALQAGGVVLPAIILYLAVYALMNLGAFAVIIALEEAEGREIVELEEFAGLGREHPLLGILLGFFLLSLAGFPPTAGFFAKFFLFTGAVLGNQVWLVLVAVVASVISVFYYARYIVAMFMQPAVEEEVVEGEVVVEEVGEVEVVEAVPLGLSWMVGTAITVTAVLVLLIGIFPNPLLGLFR
ncbi:MAG: NADH-quinone oxidoreductase subunit N [Chloroflexota bacterium]|nr:NADH-quinone oxidoreductase subunit N [Chloroflexota bacterium]